MTDFRAEETKQRAKAAVKSGLHKACKIVADKSLEKVPRESGRLARSIYIEANENDLSVKVGYSAKYAGYVHEKSKDKFLTQPFYSAQSQIIDILKNNCRGGGKMSVVKDIGQILHNGTIAELGVDLFLTQMPESPDSALALYETGGGGYDAMSELHTAGLSIRSRANDYETAYELIANAANELSAIGDESYFLAGLSDGVSINGNTYLRIKPESEPYPIGRDSLERVEFAQSFSLVYFANEDE